MWTPCRCVWFRPNSITKVTQDSYCHSIASLYFQNSPQFPYNKWEHVPSSSQAPDSLHLTQKGNVENDIPGSTRTWSTSAFVWWQAASTCDITHWKVVGLTTAWSGAGLACQMERWHQCMQHDGQSKVDVLLPHLRCVWIKAQSWITGNNCGGANVVNKTLEKV